MILRPARLREDELAWDALEEAETMAALEQDSFSGAETAFVPTPERPHPPGAVPEATRRRLAVSTAIFAAATGLSRILGLVREIVTANYFGVAGSINAFTVAFQIPNLIRALVADAALSSAFVPVFSELLERGERKRAWRVASSLFWLMLLGLSALTAIYILIAPWVIGALRRPGRTTRRSRSDSRASSSRSSCCSASAGSSSGSSTATTTSRCRRSRRCSGTSRSSSAS